MTASTVEAPSGFRALGLSPALLAALDRAKYLTPTPIQAEFIPHAVTGRDVLGQAQTGTGKTAAFLLPFLDKWVPTGSPNPQAIVLAPTRELVVQVAEEAKRLSPDKRLRSMPIYGGQKLQKQFTELAKGCDLAVGSPGRVIDHLRRGTLNLSNVKYVVLDEADRMLDIGFRPDIERILKQCPKPRQTLLLSATMPDALLRLVKRYMADPLHVNITPDTPTVDKIRQTYYTVDEDRKLPLLLKVLDKEKPRQCIIFCARKRGADKLYHALRDHPQHVEAMHGDLPQNQRDRIMKGFRAGDIHVLVATDVVGRGIDVTGISHIINYDLPDDIENYVHRIGRTGRMGKDGIAISFATPEQGKHLSSIEIAVNRLIDCERIEGFESFRPRAPVVDKPKAATPVFGRTIKKYSRRL